MPAILYDCINGPCTIKPVIDVWKENVFKMDEAGDIGNNPIFIFAVLGINLMFMLMYYMRYSQ